MPSFLPAPDTELSELPSLSIYPLQEVSPATFCPQMLGSSPRPLLGLPAAPSQSSNDNAILKALEVPAFLPENVKVTLHALRTKTVAVQAWSLLPLLRIHVTQSR